MNALLINLILSTGIILEQEGQLKDAPIIIEVGNIDDLMANRFMTQLTAAQSTGQSVVPVVINSYGGQVYSLISMIDAINHSKIPVATICIGKCISAGAVLLGMGANGLRYAAPNATIMLHEVSGGSEGKISAMSISIEEAKRLNNLMFSLMAKNIGRPEDYFIKLLEGKSHLDWFMTMDEVLASGIVNKVGIPDLKVKIKMTTVLE